MPISAFRVQRLFILLPLLLLLSGYANAALTNEGIFDTVLDRYATAAVTWATTIVERASWLFWVLVMISMVWTFGLMALRKADIAEFFAEFIKFIVFTGFFWWLLLNGPNFAIDIIQSLSQIAATASGSPGSFSPSSIVDIGFEILFKIYDNSSRWQPVDSAAGILIGIAILVLVALIAVNMLILLISAWILAYAGVFFLGFGGSRWTSDMAINYFRTVLSVAVQLFTMVLLVGIGKTFVDQYKAAMSEGVNLNELTVMLVVLLILFHLVNKVPPMIGQLPFGGGTGALGNGFGGGTALAATAVAGAAIYSAAKGMAGGAQAISAAYGKASAAEAAGGGTTSTTTAAGQGGGDNNSSGGALASASPGGGSGGDSSGSSGGGGSSSSSSFSSGGGGGDSGSGSSLSKSTTGNSKGMMGTAAAGLSKAGRIAAGTASNLAKGSMDVAKNGVNERLGKTTGGKIAAAIKARAAAEMNVPTKGQSEEFAGNSLSAGSEKSVDAAAEVAAFRDKTA